MAEVDISVEALTVASVLGADEVYVNRVLDDRLVKVPSSTLGGSGSGPQIINAQTGTTYTLVLADATKLVTMSNGAASTLTVPPNSSVAIAVGDRVDVSQLGAGQVTLAAGVGVTLYYTASLKLRAQFSAVSLLKIATNSWLLVGDFEPIGQSINAQTGTTYTPVLADADKLVTLSNGAAITLTVPTNASVAYPTGTRIDFAQIGAGQVTFVGDSGVTVSSTPTLKLRAQYSGATLVKTGTNTWLLFGDLAAS